MSCCGSAACSRDTESSHSRSLGSRGDVQPCTKPAPCTGGTFGCPESSPASQEMSNTRRQGSLLHSHLKLAFSQGPTATADGRIIQGDLSSLFPLTPSPQCLLSRHEHDFFLAKMWCTARLSSLIREGMDCIRPASLLLPAVFIEGVYCLQQRFFLSILPVLTTLVQH